MRDAVTKRSITIRGHRTSVSLENGFWERFRGIAHMAGRPIGELAAEIDGERRSKTLSSAIRLFVLAHALDAS